MNPQDILNRAMQALGNVGLSPYKSPIDMRDLPQITKMAGKKLQNVNLPQPNVPLPLKMGLPITQVPEQINQFAQSTGKALSDPSGDKLNTAMTALQFLPMGSTSRVVSKLDKFGDLDTALDIFKNKTGTAEDIRAATDTIMKEARQQLLQPEISKLKTYEDVIKKMMPRVKDEEIGMDTLEKVKNLEIEKGLGNKIDLSPNVAPQTGGGGLEALKQEARKYKSAEEFVNSLKQDKGIMWHGSPTGQMRGGKQGLHIGTFQAAQDALEARIGIPASGNAWNGTTEYGKTLLAGKKTQQRLGRGGTGFNVDVPENDFYPSQLKGWENPQYSLKDKPTIQPVQIKGQMSNSPQAPMGDFQAGGRMAGLIKKGKAKSGYFYRNVSEDEGSISAVVPSKEHLSQLTDIWNKSQGVGGVGK